MNPLTEQQKRINPNSFSNEIMSKDGKWISAYDILKMEGCPYTLPRARSMTQAMIDYKSLEPSVFEWYNTTLKNEVDTRKG